MVEPNVSVNEEGTSPYRQSWAALTNCWSPANRERSNISRAPTGANFDFPQINNAGRIVTRELSGGHSVVRLWKPAASARLK
ncbi:MAG: hypothetical protein R3F11_14635 [Verrucomicrobiales bacterium]